MEITERIKNVLVDQLGLTKEEIDLDSRLVDDLQADSLDVVEIIMDLEQEFELEIPDDDLSKIVTVKDIVDYVEKRVN